jgi:thiamine biosynthesis lipoprotein
MVAETLLDRVLPENQFRGLVALTVPENGPVAQTTQRAMGTVMTRKAFGLHAQDSLEAVCSEIVEVFKSFGISSAYSNLGGNVVTVGAKPDGSPWQIGIQHPQQENGLIGSVSVVNQTVVTSGDYQRTFTDSRGKRHHHILDPTTGCPAESGLISVSIVTDRSVAADPLSTIVFVAGMEKGLTFLRSFPNIEAILVDSEPQVHVTRGLSDRFQAARDLEVTILDQMSERRRKK